MQQVLNDLPLTLAYIGADLVALAILVGALYIPRHGRRDLVAASLEVLEPIPAIRTTMVLHGYDIYSPPLTTGAAGHRQLSTPSPGDEDAEFALSDTPLRRVATPSEHPASDRDPTASKATTSIDTSRRQHSAGR